MIESFEHVRLVIIDEISMASPENIREIDKKLCKLTQNLHAKYGNLDIAFMGDFSQLPAIGTTKQIYEDDTLVE